MDTAVYREFCEGNNAIPLFMRPYWLDAIVPGKWDAVLSKDKKGKIVGAWALYQLKRKGRQAIVLPDMTPYTGIYLDIDESLPYQKQGLQRQLILEDLISQLPSVSIFEQKFKYTLQDWAPFYWEGYKQETRYTFRFDTIDSEQILANTTSSFRRNLRAARRQFTVEQSTDVGELFSMVENVFEIRGDKLPFKQDRVSAIVTALQDRDQCTIYRARDMQGTSTVILVVWDDDTTYYLLGGRSGSNTKNSMNLLIWQAILDAEARGQSFDFEGSMIKGVHRYFQTFGARMTPYLYVYKYKDLAKIKLLG